MQRMRSEVRPDREVSARVAGWDALVGGAVVVKIKEVAIKVANGELKQTGRLQLQRGGDESSPGFELRIKRVDIVREDPVDGRLEERHLAAKEDHRIAADHGSDLSVGVRPADIEAESFFVMLLCEFHVSDR
jgi:hypothetical protein